MAIRSVSALVLDGLAVFEFGVICEVFGIDRSTDGVPNFDFKVCGPEPGKPLRTSVGATITPDHGLDQLIGADLVAIPAIAGTEYLPEALRRCGPPQIRLDHPDRVLGRFRRWRGWAARRQAVHHALDARRRSRKAVPDRQGRPQRVVRRRREPDHQRRHRGGHRCLPAPGPQGAGQRGHQQIARRMVVPPQRDGGQRQYIDQPIPVRCSEGFAPHLDWILGNLTSRTASPRWPPGRTCRRARSPAGSSRRPGARRCSG